MSKLYVKDRNGTIYIGIQNFYNSFCYYISTVQRLHSSITLNNLLLKPCEDVPKYALKIIEILKVYAKITEENIEQIYKEMNNFQNVIEKILHQKMKNGGNPDEVLKCLFLPIIFTMYPRDFCNILNEIRYNPIHISKSKLMIDSKFELTNDEKFNNWLKNSYDKMESSLKDFVIKNYNFNITTMSIMIRDENGNINEHGGHAVNLVRGYDGIYIIDDNVNIRDINNYIQNVRNSIKQIELTDIDDETINILKNSCSGFDVNKRIYRVIITPNVTQSLNMIGGVLINTGDKINKILMCVSIALLVVFILIIVIRYIKKKNLESKIEYYQKKTKEIYKKIESIESVESNENNITTEIKEKKFVPISPWLKGIPKPTLTYNVNLVPN